MIGNASTNHLSYGLQSWSFLFLVMVFKFCVYRLGLAPLIGMAQYDLSLAPLFP